jgi:hypothetical protein
MNQFPFAEIFKIANYFSDNFGSSAYISLHKHSRVIRKTIHAPAFLSSHHLYGLECFAGKQTGTRRKGESNCQPFQRQSQRKMAV